ncbi:hypothetical protein LXL04_024520 [Taraxacum kok-saghyz]
MFELPFLLLHNHLVMIMIWWKIMCQTSNVVVYRNRMLSCVSLGVDCGYFRWVGPAVTKHYSITLLNMEAIYSVVELKKVSTKLATLTEKSKKTEDRLFFEKILRAYDNEEAA